MNDDSTKLTNKNYFNKHEENVCLRKTIETL